MLRVRCGFSLFGGQDRMANLSSPLGKLRSVRASGERRMTWPQRGAPPASDRAFWPRRAENRFAYQNIFP
eukprot:scaffold18538_cov157-Isochrysis_galbana.AAC.1